MNKIIEFNGYNFTSLAEDPVGRGISKLLNYPASQSSLQSNLEEYGKTTAQFRGSLLQLFGPPLYSSNLADEAFYYAIEATDARGNVYLLTAYEGPSGPAIGAEIFQRKESKAAAESLVELIAITEPADFETIIYDEDTDSTIIYGCNDGECYYEEKET